VAEEAARSAAALRAGEEPLAETNGAAIADTSGRTEALPKRKEALPKRKPGATERPGPLRPVPLDHQAAPRGPEPAADKSTEKATDTATDKAADTATGKATGKAAEDEPLVVDGEVVEEWADEELEPVDAEVVELEDPPGPDEEGLSVPTSFRAPGSGPSMGSRLTADEPAGDATKIVPAVKPDTPLTDEPEPTLPSPAPAARVDSPAAASDAPTRSRPGTSPTAGQPDARPGTSPTAGQPEGAPEAPWQHHVTAPTPRLSPAGGLAGLAQPGTRHHPGTPPPGAAGLAPGAHPTQAGGHGRRLAPGSEPGHYAGGQPTPGGRRLAPGGHPAPGGRPGGQPMPGGHLPAAGLADPATGARPMPPGDPTTGGRPLPPGGQPGPGGWGHPAGPPRGPGNVPPGAFGGRPDVLPAGFTPAVPNGEMPPPHDRPAAQSGPPHGGPALAPPHAGPAAPPVDDPAFREPRPDDDYDDHYDEYDDDEYDDEPTTGDAVRAAVDAWRDSDVLALPLPPAPPGERGYRPGDVEKLINLLADALDDTDDGPRPDDLAGLKLSRTFFIGQGYHIGAVEALRSAWISELKRREL
jgi:hypothetical protein